MRTTLIATAAGLVMTATTTAQLTHTIPNGTATRAGNTSNAFPWGSDAAGWPGLRLMAVYGSVNFTAATPPITVPIVISRLKWRVQDGTQSWSGGTFATASVSLSTAAVSWSSVTTNFATNHGPDLTLAYQGPVTVVGGTSNGVGVVPPYVVDIHLTTPFVYDPSHGDLVIDVDYPGFTNFTGGAPGQMDVEGTGSNSSRIYASSFYPAANGTTVNHGPVVELEYLPASGYASFTTYGQGCGGGAPPGLYELFSASPNDLANTGITMFYSGGAYVVVQGASPIVAPTGGGVPLGDDQTTQVPLPFTMPYQSGATSNLWVCSNGWIAFESTTSTSYIETVGELLAGPARVCAYWDDLNPGAGGTVSAQVDPLNPSQFHVTWSAVPEFTNTGSNTFQASFDSSGVIELKWGNMTSVDGLVGFHPGHNLADPGPTDISALTVAVLGNGLLPLTLQALPGSRPVLGTTFQQVIGQVPSGPTIAVSVVGFTQFNPGIDLTSAGMTGCNAYTTLDILNYSPAAGPSVVLPLAIPNFPQFAGVHVFSQGAVFAAVNPFGVIATNGGNLRLDLN